MNTSRPLNLKHLRYFAAVARAGAVTAAARALHITPQTVSTQVHELEQSVGQPLFERVRKRMVLTPAGELALDYANTIFALGDELEAMLRGRSRAKHVVLRIGVTDSVPKLLTVSVLGALLDRHRKELELVCREGSFASLLGRLAAGEFDAVLADAAVPANLSRSLQARVLTQSGLSFVAAKPLARRLARGFPKSLNGAPYLSGSASSSLIGQAIDAWFARHDVRPLVAGRIDDSALLKGFAQIGLGVAAVPTAIEDEVTHQYGLAVVGRTTDIRQEVFLIRARSRQPHPLVAELEAMAVRTAS